MTEQPTPERPAAPRPIPDLGFFAGPPSRGASAFGGAPVAALPSSPAPGNQFGSAPTTPFGAPAPLASFGPGPNAPTRTKTRSSGSTVMVVAVVIGLVVLALAVTGGRFGWRHFVANPVVPDTLQGMPRLTDPEVEAQLSEAQDSLGSELTAGSEVKAAVYSHGRGSGYMLFAMRGSSRPGEEDNSTEGWTESKQGKAQCFAKGPQAQAGFAVTFCVRGFFRRAVVVMAIGGVAQYPAIVAEATEEAWNAQ